MLLLALHSGDFPTPAARQEAINACEEAGTPAEFHRADTGVWTCQGSQKLSGDLKILGRKEMKISEFDAQRFPF